MNWLWIITLIFSILAGEGAGRLALALGAEDYLAGLAHGCVVGCIWLFYLSLRAID